MGSISFPVNYKDGAICKSSSHGTLEGTALGALWHDFLLSLCQLCLVWEETGQLHSGAFLLTFWPLFLRCVHVFTCISWRTEVWLLGITARKEAAPLPLVGRSGALVWPQTKSRGFWIKQSMSHFAKGKKDHSFLCSGLVGWLKAQIVVMNNLHGHWLFSRVKPYTIGETKGPASHLPACQHYGHHFYPVS